ncbi:DUF2336 domain-containing protein [Brucella gallinifaecis]|uniref:DUF2336 domain-containing protein n=1 Tax=Brucella gallinifaecis TaxID=215590 RepID=A0A502BQH0_9HYPH|nr:DUF2336 domain-containing protein [Brucella gallinifaecis]TPF76077.1 DUF2336 domain-containing protein [Brucella gallinifaecis]
MTNDQFRVLEDFSSNRNQSKSTADNSKADDLLVAAIAAFASLTRPGRQDAHQLEDLALPLLERSSMRGKQQAANAIAQIEHAPRRLILALANEPVKISAPVLLRSPVLKPQDLIEIISKNGLVHARAIARRQSDDPLLKGVLRSFNDAVIDRLLVLQENLACIETDKAGTSSALDEDKNDDISSSPPPSLFGAGTLATPEHLIDTALLIDDQIFRTALADSLDISFDHADRIIGKWPESHLPIALRALGMSAAECFIIMSAILGPVVADRNELRDFIQIYHSIDQEKAISLVRRWKAEEMSKSLRNKLREMVTATDENNTSIRVSL